MTEQEAKRIAEAARAEINSHPLTFYETLEKAKHGGYICPICGNGSGDSGTGIAVTYHGNNRVWCDKGQCFGAKGEDTTGALCRIRNMTQWELFKALGIVDANNRTTAEILQKAAKPMRPICEPKPEPEHDFSQEVGKWADALQHSATALDYLHGRGLTDETIKRFMLGYDAFCYNKALGRKAASIVIPYGRSCRYIITRPLTEKQYDKPKTTIAGREPLYNVAALYSDKGGACFVVESPLCAISIEQAGAEAVAVGGTGNARLIEQLADKPTNKTLILCYDRDKPGQAAQQAAAAELTKLGVDFIEQAIMTDEQKDPNGALQADAEQFYRNVRQAIAATRAPAADGKEQGSMSEQTNHTAPREAFSGAAMIDCFIEQAQTRRYAPIPTGIKELDEAIGGGFVRQQLVMLGAPPAAGKTALAQWIFDSMARNGHTILFINLEMSREQLIARSLAATLSKAGKRYSANKIMRGYEWTDEQRAAILAAADTYKREVAERMTFNPDGASADLTKLMNSIEQAAEEAEAVGRKAPIVVLDYLQLITDGASEDDGAIIKRAVRAFKAFAIEHNTLFFCIMAHNRASNKTGDADMQSGRDTSAIEYSADLQLALTYAGCTDYGAKMMWKKDVARADTPDKLKPKEKAIRLLKVTKARFADDNQPGTFLLFDGETMSYMAIPPNKLQDYLIVGGEQWTNARRV